MHRHVNRVSAEEGHPEMPLAECLVVHLARDFGKPVIDGPEHNQDWRHAHHHVEMCDDEVGIGQRQVDRDVTQEQTRQAAMNEREHEADREQHRHPEVNVALPQCQHPVVNLDCGRHGNNQCRRREEEPEIRMHTTDIHMMRPDDERQAADRNERPDHHSITENIFARVRTQQVRNNAERRQRHDVHLGMTEEPEQVLEQDRAAARATRIDPHGTHCGHEETRAEVQVEQHHYCGDEQCRECQQTEDCRNEDAPDRQRQPHQRHATATRLQNSGHVVQAAHCEGYDKYSQRQQHEQDAVVDARCSGTNGLRRVQGPASAR